MSRNTGLQADPLFVAATRPPMRAGVTTAGIVLGAMVTIELFLLSKNLLWLLAYLPIHGVLALLLRNEYRFFDLLSLWAKTKGLNWIKGNYREWQCSSYTPNSYNVADSRRRRKLPNRIPL